MIVKDNQKETEGVSFLYILKDNRLISIIKVLVKLILCESIKINFVDE
jgi:hypothetical protein